MSIEAPFIRHLPEAHEGPTPEEWKRKGLELLRYNDLSRGENVESEVQLEGWLRDTRERFAKQWEGKPKNGEYHLARACTKLLEARAIAQHLRLPEPEVTRQVGWGNLDRYEKLLILSSSAAQQSIVHALVTAPDRVTARQMMRTFCVASITPWNGSSADTFTRSEQNTLREREAAIYDSSRRGVAGHVATVRLLRQAFPEWKTWAPHERLDVHEAVDFGWQPNGKLVSFLIQVKARKNTSRKIELYGALGGGRGVSLAPSDLAQDMRKLDESVTTRLANTWGLGAGEEDDPYAQDLAPHLQGIIIVLKETDTDTAGAFDSESGFLEDAFLQEYGEQVRRSVRQMQKGRIFNITN